MALLSMHPYLLFLPFSFLGMGWMGPLLGGLKRWILRFPWVDFPPCKTRVSSFIATDWSVVVPVSHLPFFFAWVNDRKLQSPFFLIVAFHVVSSPSTCASTCRFRNARGWSNVVLRIT